MKSPKHCYFIMIMAISMGFGAYADAVATSLTIEDRIANQRAIEWIYYTHQESLKQGSAAILPFELEVPDDYIRESVETCLRQSNALKYNWNRELTGEEIQQELNRMITDSLRPDILQELFAALDFDPRRIAETIARPILVENLIRTLFSRDSRYQGAVHARAKKEWAGIRTVSEAKTTSGIYAESEWVLAIDPYTIAGNQPEPIEGPTYLDQKEWRRLERDLRVEYGMSDISPGRIGPVKENDFSYYAGAVVSITQTRILVARVTWEKEPFDLWWEKNRDTFEARITEPVFQYELKEINLTSDSRAGNDFWSAISTTGAPSNRSKHKACWTGSMMIVWGGWNGSTYFQSGGRYYPATDSWLAMSTADAPSGRRDFTGIMASGDFIVWGGYSGISLNTGAAYDPSTNHWVTTFCSSSGPPCNAPVSRYNHVAMDDGINYGFFTIWGGDSSSGELRSGASYIHDTWTATDQTDPDCPSERYYSTAVRVFAPWENRNYTAIWGGYDRLDDGGRINLDESGETWLSLSDADSPSGRHNHAAVAYYTTTIPSESKMLIWGGYVFGVDIWSNKGGVYDSIADEWLSMSSSGTPAGRQNLTAVWTGKEMIVWGGDQSSSCTNTGGRYNLFSDTWSLTDTSDTDTPSPRTEHTAAWAGTGMLVWGGYNLTSRFNNGGIYRSCSSAPQGNIYWYANDTDTCSASGIYLAWDPDCPEWGDYGFQTASRSYYVLRDGLPLGSGSGCDSPIAYGTSSCTDTSAVVGTSYTYSIRYVNSCGQDAVLGDDGIASDQAADYPSVSNAPVAADDNLCTVSGIRITWDQDPSDWGDGGSGPSVRTYVVRRSDNGINFSNVSPVLSYGTVSYVDATVTTGQPYWYRVRYFNKCDLYTASPTSNAVIDLLGSDPTVTTAATFTDEDGCANTGILVGWPKDPDNWGDYGSGTRTYVVRRSTDNSTFTDVSSALPYGTTAYVDAGAAPSVPYWYKVRYFSGCGGYTTTPTTGLPAVEDLVGFAPTISTNSSSVDPEYCVDGGINVSWPQNPSSWGDNAIGTRTYSVLRAGTPVVTGLAYGTTDYTDTTGVNGITYLYQVSYTNGCGLTATTAGTSSIDRPFQPAQPVNNSADDNDTCTWDGVMIAWAKDPPSSTWGDGGEGNRTYQVLRDGSAIQTGIAYGTTTWTDTTGVNDQTYNYTVRYVNGCGLTIDTSPGVASADSKDVSACPDVSDTLLLVKSDAEVTLSWGTVSCVDLANYRIYRSNSFSAEFPAGWELFSSPTETTDTDDLAAAYIAYRIVSVDICGNESPD